MKIYFCPVCGFRSPAYRYKSECPDCHCISTTMESKHDREFYFEEALRIYNNENAFNRVLNEQEIFINPYFNPNARDKAWKEFDEKCGVNEPSIAPPIENLTQNVPTCPTCHSTNVKKISFAKGYLHWRAFGLFSKTARSQWECKNCGNKW